MKKNICLISLILFVFFGSFAFAQDTQEVERRNEPLDPTFEQEVRVSLQLVDVRVMDRDGNYLRNLPKDAFTVRIDGEKVEIRSFDVYSSDYERKIQDLASSSIVDPINAPGRTLVIFFDHPFSDLRTMNQAKQGVRDFLLNNARPNDSIMLAGYERSFKLYSPLTGEFEKTLAVLEKIRHQNSNDTDFVDKQTVDHMTEGDIQGNEETEAGDEGEGQNEGRYEFLRNMNDNEREYYITSYLDSLDKFASYLGTIPGRKTLVLVSGGYDQFFAMRRNLNVIQQRLFRTFNNANISIYTIDVARFESRHRVGQSGSGRIQTAEEASNVNKREVFNVGSYDLSLSRRQSLQSLAEATGGEFYFAGNDISNLFDKLHNDTSNYYVLGFQARDLPDGNYNKIDVQVDRSGARVIHREGYASPRSVSNMKRNERLAHLESGFNRSRPLKEFKAEFELFLFPRSDGDVISGVTIEIPLNKGSEQEYELFGHVLDSEGTIVDAFHSVYEFSSGDARTFSHFQPLLLDKTSSTIKIGVRDNHTSQRAYHFFRVNRRNTQAPVKLSSICYVEPVGPVVIRSDSGEVKKVDLGYSLYDDPARTAALDPMQPIREKKNLQIIAADRDYQGDFVEVAIKIAIADPEYSNNDLGIGFMATTESGETIKLKTNRTEYFRAPGVLEIFVHAIVDISVLEPGDYQLIALVTSSHDNQTATQKTQLSVM